MKRIFRSTKSPIVDPLPPPDAGVSSRGGQPAYPSDSSRDSTPTQTSALGRLVSHKAGKGNGASNTGVSSYSPDAAQSALSNPSSGRSTPQHQAGKGITAIFSGHEGQSPQSHEHKWGFVHRHQAEVTPFPMDAGSDPAPVQQTSLGRKGTKTGPRSGGAAPSLLEMKQMQERGMQSQPEDVARRRPQGQPPPDHAGQRISMGYQSSPSPDGWTVVSNPGGVGSPAHDPTRPLPIPNASFSRSYNNSPTNSSPSSQTHNTSQILPPGARSPTPPGSGRPTYPLHMRYSQSNLHTSTTPRSGDPVSPGTAKSGRDRGYSSPVTSHAAPFDHSDYETHTVHTHTPHNNKTAHVPVPMLYAAPTSPTQTKTQPPSRSPLGFSYLSGHDAGDLPTSFPAPKPYAPSPGIARALPPPGTIGANTAAASQYPKRSSSPPVEPKPNPYSSVGPDEMATSKDLPPKPIERDEAPAPEKEKKRFWQKGRSDKKARSKAQTQAEHAGGHGSMQSLSLSAQNHQGQGDWRPSMEDSRPSMEVWRAESLSASTHGHQTEEEPRGRLLGLDLGPGGRRESTVSQGNTAPADAFSAIRLLCLSDDPSPSAIYEVCDRINLSESPESIGKESAQALRKEFKHGDEGRRRNAAKVWLLLMRNVTAKGFRPYASNKKFFQTLEPILFASPAKPLVSASTHRLITDVIADLTYSYGMEKGCEMLGEVWKKIKLPQEPAFGRPLSDDHPIINPEVQKPVSEFANTQLKLPPNVRQSSYNSANALPPPRHQNSHGAGPGYGNLPSHSEDIRRLVEECTAAKESAKVLSDALVYTRPEEIEHKPIIREFYQKVFHAHESLTNQMDWAQAEAAQSRERSLMLNLDGHQAQQHQQSESTQEENALAALFEAHAALAEVMQQHDQLERMAEDEREMREVRERSKKETKMDRTMLTTGLEAPTHNHSSSSRSPSPTPPAPLPSTRTPAFASKNPFANSKPSSRPDTYVSRTPSPVRHPLPHIPKLTSSPGRTSSPLGTTVGKLKMGGPRPLPNPMKGFNGARDPSLSGSQASLSTVAGGGGTGGAVTAPSRSGTGDSSYGSVAGSQVGRDTGNGGEEVDEEGLPKIPIKPSRKALGKRRAVLDEDNDFDPNDMFNSNPTDPRARETAAEDVSSDESLTADALLNQRPVIYAYDAYEESLKDQKRMGALEETMERLGGYRNKEKGNVGGSSG